MKKALSLLALILLLAANQLIAQQNTGLPEWPIRPQPYNNSTSVADQLNAEKVLMGDNQSPHTFDIIQNTKAQVAGPAQAGFDCCGHMIFYVLHDGSPDDNHLNIYLADGTILLANPGLNGYAVDNEVQCVPVPTTCNEWFIIYNKNGVHPYNPSVVLYSRVKITGNVLSIVNNERDVVLSTNTGTYTYSYGKAVSPLIAAPGRNPYYFLYLYRRTDDTTDNAKDSIIIDRFRINEISGITFDCRSNSIYDVYWGDGDNVGTVIGSPLELSSDGNFLAANVRKQACDQEPKILLYKTAGFEWQTPSIIKLCDLTVAGNNNESYLANWSRKIYGLEFSPQGQQLWISCGGYVKGKYSNLTYIGTIKVGDYLNGGSPPTNVYLQCQITPNWQSSDGKGDSWTGLTDINYIKSHMIGGMKKSYDGNMYFNKSNVDSLYVIPNTYLENDCPVNLSPHDVNFSSSTAKNIPVKGYPNYLPDQIDEFNYLGNNILVTISGAPSSDVYVGSTVTLTGSPAGGTWSIIPGQPLSITPPTCNFTPNSAGTFTVFYSDSSCVDSVKINVIKKEGKDSICGRKIWDRNCNGIQDPQEGGLAGWTFQLIQNSTVIATTTTDTYGNFCFTGLADGAYTVQELIQSGYTPSQPSSGSFNVVVDSSHQGVYNLIFLNCLWSDTICGSKIQDNNCNGIYDSGDIGIPGWPIDLIHNGVVIMHATTDANGNFCFFNLQNGAYTIVEGTVDGYTPKNPASGQFSIVLDSNTHFQNLIFLNCKDSISPHTDCCDEANFEVYDGNDDPDQREGKTIVIKNLKDPQSPISSVDIQYYDCSTNTQITDNGTLNQLSGGHLAIFNEDETPENINLFGTAWFGNSNHYQHFPHNNGSGFPAFGSGTHFQDRISFYITLPLQSVPQTWCIKLIIHHEDGNSCICTLPAWDPGSSHGDVIITPSTNPNKVVHVICVELDRSSTMTTPVGYVLFKTLDPKDEIIGATGGVWENATDFDSLSIVKKQVQSKSSVLFYLTNDNRNGPLNVFILSEKRPDPDKAILEIYSSQAGYISTDSVKSSFIVNADEPLSKIMTGNNDISIDNIAPNPATGNIVIDYSMKQAEFIQMDLFNPLGQLVAQVCSGYQENGYHRVSFDGSLLSNGRYILRLSSKSGTAASIVTIIH